MGYWALWEVGGFWGLEAWVFSRPGRARPHGVLVSCGWLSKLGSLFGYPNDRCRTIIRTPKRDPNFDNHPCSRVGRFWVGRFRTLGFGVRGG